MTFKVLKKGKVVFWTEHKECIPPKEQIEAMQEAGYEIEYNAS